MLTRIWAVLRSIVLIGIVGYAIWVTPWMPAAAGKPLAEQYDRLAFGMTQTRNALWLAVAWIALEAAVGWLVVWKNAHADRSELKKALKEAKATQPPPEKPTGG